MRLLLERTTRLAGVAAVLTLLGAPGESLGALISSFESGDFDGWNAPDVNGAPSAVNTNRATNGIYSTQHSFTVPAGWAGWGTHTLLSKDTAAIGVTGGTTEISLDAYGDWSNPNGWGVYSNNIWLIANYEGGYHYIEPSSGGLPSNGTFATITFDISPYAAAMSAPSLSYSALEIIWHLGTYADNGQDNGTQTINIDNINGNNLAASVPEPAAFLLLASTALAMFCYGRHHG
ncbi:hypothetical protein Pla175_24800 [Pirellulimonas nuda]|uniref:PEP-CTERM protein-sorting domain-containing protein n=1 Tax=Pirellulimonas nuda TaxID=2528009 RepID=A0A518DC83_9BACT|nr:hypothetical protein [Pirellulimonas nuda]QDU89094.1 hypothetical protein Pla175_24800 [Pirellulimonas nuda]